MLQVVRAAIRALVFMLINVSQYRLCSAMHFNKLLNTSNSTTAYTYIFKGRKQNCATNASFDINAKEFHQLLLSHVTKMSLNNRSLMKLSGNITGDSIKLTTLDNSSKSYNKFVKATIVPDTFFHLDHPLLVRISFKTT